MTSEQLKEGQELKELIEITKTALQALKEIKPKKRTAEKMHDDKVFNLYICEYKDGSGIYANLARYSGNVDLLKVIKKELERQLKDFESQFEKL